MFETWSWLVGSKWLWRRCVTHEITILLDFIHHPIFYTTKSFGNQIYLHSQVERWETHALLVTTELLGNTRQYNCNYIRVYSWNQGLSAGGMREILQQNLCKYAYKPEINYGFGCWFSLLHLFFMSFSTCILVSGQESAADVTQCGSWGTHLMKMLSHPCRTTPTSRREDNQRY
jgi:hypothetical protein